MTAVTCDVATALNQLTPFYSHPNVLRSPRLCCVASSQNQYQQAAAEGHRRLRGGTQQQRETRVWLGILPARLEFYRAHSSKWRSEDEVDSIPSSEVSPSTRSSD